MTGMFGAQPNWGEAIAAALNGYLAAGGNQVGTANLQQMHQRRMLEQRHQQDLLDYEKQRQDGLVDYGKKKGIDAQYRAPDEFTQRMIAAGIDPNSDAGKQLYRMSVQNEANPFTAVTVENPDGSERREFMRPPTAPTAPVGNLRPLGAGGQTAPLSGPFPDIGPYHRY